MKKSIGSGRGSVYNILLKALQSGDKYGYEICKEVEEKTNGDYILKQASLYSGLKRLEAQNMITSYWKDSALGGRRHYYSLTDAGKQKIDASNFSWEDSRDDIVETLFEKSNVDQAIDDVTNDIDSLKKVAEEEKTQNDKIDQILESTKNLVTTQNQDDAIANTNNIVKNESLDSTETKQASNDLFSMFNNVEVSNENINKSPIETNETENTTTDKLPKQSELDLFNFQNSADKPADNDAVLNDEVIRVDQPSEQNKVDEVISSENQTVVDDKLSVDIKSNENAINLSTNNSTNETATESIKQEENAENIVNEPNVLSNLNSVEKTDIKNIEDKQLDLFSYAEKTREEVNSDVKDTSDDIADVSLNTSNKNIENQNDDLPLFNIQNKQTQTELQKNDEDAVNSYKKQHIILSSFADNQTYELPSKNSFADFFVPDNSVGNETENLKDDNDNSMQVKTDQADDILSKFDALNDKPNLEEKPLENQSQDNNKIDIKNIFGNLVSTNVESTPNNTYLRNEDVDKTQIATNTTSSDYQKNDEFSTNTFSNSPSSSVVDELPRAETPKNDINRTLNFNTENVSRINNYPTENPFDKLDRSNNDSQNYGQDTYDSNSTSWQNEQIDETKQIQSYSNIEVPFDQKCGGTQDDFAVQEYQVRYYKKQQDKSATKFISINKLNLVNTFIISLLLCLATTICLIVTEINVTNISKFQTFLFIVSYALPMAVLIYNFFKYLANKQKKVAMLNRSESIINLFVAILVLFLSISINLFMGMNFSNIMTYSASFILPICYVAAFLLIPFTKKLLSRFSAFYN